MILYHAIQFGTGGLYAENREIFLATVERTALD
jgi:hypothetical protein